MPSPKLVVRPHNSRIGWFALALFLFVAVFAGWRLFQFGYQRAGVDVNAYRQQNRGLLQQVASLREENQALQQQVARLTADGQVAEGATEALQATVKRLQAESLDLRREVAFYRGILSPENARAGIRVQSFRLTAAASSPATYRYALVLIQGKNHDRIVSGQVKISVHGTLNGEYTRLKWSEITTSDDAMTYSFRYFQNFEGRVSLPEGFLPERVELQLIPKGRKAGDPSTESFSWSALLS